MTQPSFDFTPPPERLAYRGATHTAVACSRQAAVEARVFAPTQAQRVLAHYVACGHHGATDVEVSAAIGIARASLCLRRRELMKAKLVEDAGRWRKHGRVACTVYRAVAR